MFVELKGVGYVIASYEIWSMNIGKANMYVKRHSFRAKQYTINFVNKPFFRYKKFAKKNWKWNEMYIYKQNKGR